MFRAILTRRGPPAAGTVDVARPLRVVRMLVLVMVAITVPLAKSPVTGPAVDVAVAVALGVCVVSGLAWQLASGRRRMMVANLAVMAVAGGALAGLSPLSPALAIGCMAAAGAGVDLSIEHSLGILAGIVAAFLAAGLVMRAPAETLLGYPVAFIGMWAFGLTRHAYRLRAEEAERTLAETRRAHDAETKAAALSERARIAREIHDVLAHSLAAVSVNLQAAEGLLGELPESPELAKAVECIGRAGAFTREGLADARRAILALRDDAAPLADLLSTLVEEYRSDGDLAVEFGVTGSSRRVPAEAGLAVYRTAQEALTNVRKHAPGQPARLSLEFSPSEVTVRVVNPLPPVNASRPLAATGAGYGLTGLRERAALGGGTLTAGPAGGQWQVCLRIPV